MKRLGKAIRAANQIREYCAMCDLQFYGHLSTHRKSEGHLELKKFLHPKCDDCTTEFHNRTEFDDHLLSANHMKTSKTPPSYNSEESRKNRLQILTEADEILGLREEKPKKEKGKEVSKEGETTEDAAKTEQTGENESMETDTVAENKTEAEIKQEAEDADDAENQNDQPESDPILDFNEGDEIGPEIENKIPKYNCKRQVGSNLISKLVCFECRLCNKYFDTETTAEIHSRTYNHHRLFVKFLNEKANETKIAQKRAAAAAEETERLKLVKLEPAVEPTPDVVTKSELYDPTEATVDDDMKDNGESTDVVMAEENKTEEQLVKVPEKVDSADVSIPAIEVVPMVIAPEPTLAPVAEPTAVVVTPSVTPTAEVIPVVAPVVAPVVTPVAAPVAAPVVAASAPTQPAQNQLNQQQNNTPNKQFNNNRGRGRGNNNNNRRSGRYGGRY